MILQISFLALTLQPTPASSISGHISWGHGLNVNRCIVKIKGTTIKDDCDSYGNFRIESVPPGNKDLEIRVNDLLVATRKINIPIGAPLFLGDIVLGLGGAIKGDVLVADGVKTGSVVLGIPALGKFVTPDSNGDFLITDIPSGIFEVTAQMEGKPFQNRRIEVKSGAVTFGAHFDLRQ